MSHELLTPDDVADLLDVSVQTLASWRSSGRYDLPYVKIGRLVRYRKSAVDEFLDDFDADESEDHEDSDEDSDEADDEAA
jgi:excisionase family DNA binding protein